MLLRGADYYPGTNKKCTKRYVALLTPQWLTPRPVQTKVDCLEERLTCVGKSSGF
jgi:hypothetical protein